MREIPGAEAQALDSFAAEVLSSAFVDELVTRTGLERASLVERLETSVAEARQTLRVLAGLQLRADGRVLELGAGLGITSCFLARQGFHITALEPGGSGFEENMLLSRSIAELTSAIVIWIDRPAEELDPARDGPFDLVFSNNVIEHVREPALALDRACSVLAPGGISVHSCPNYSIPYEPHFGLPLVPFQPASTARMLPARIGSSSLWASLNFIRARDVTTWAAANGREVYFREAVLARSVERLATDSAFRSRHRVLAAVASAMRPLGLIAALRRLPATWSTPMDFVMCGADVDRVTLDLWTFGGDSHD